MLGFTGLISVEVALFEYKNEDAYKAGDSPKLTRTLRSRIKDRSVTEYHGENWEDFRLVAEEGGD